MELIVKVTSPSLRAPLVDLLRLPLGLDVWEVKTDHLILRAAEPQIDRLARMGYGVEQMQDVETHLRAFATAEAVSGYHSAASLEQELQQLADTRPDIAELRSGAASRAGRSMCCASVSATKLGGPRSSSWAATMRANGSPWRYPSSWPRS